MALSLERISATDRRRYTAPLKEGEEVSRAAVAVLLRVVVLLPRRETTSATGPLLGRRGFATHPQTPISNPAPAGPERCGSLGSPGLLGVHAITAAGEVIG